MEINGNWATPHWIDIWGLVLEEHEEDWRKSTHPDRWGGLSNWTNPQDAERGSEWECEVVPAGDVRILEEESDELHEETEGREEGR